MASILATDGTVITGLQRYVAKLQFTPCSYMIWSPLKFVNLWLMRHDEAFVIHIDERILNFLVLHIIFQLLCRTNLYI